MAGDPQTWISSRYQAICWRLTINKVGYQPLYMQHEKKLRSQRLPTITDADFEPRCQPQH